MFQVYEQKQKQYFSRIWEKKKFKHMHKFCLNCFKLPVVNRTKNLYKNTLVDRNILKVGIIYDKIFIKQYTSQTFKKTKKATKQGKR